MKVNSLDFSFQTNIVNEKLSDDQTAIIVKKCLNAVRFST